MASTTLRARAGIAPLDALDPAHTALVLIDLQEEYFADGALPLPDGPAALAHAAELLGWARASGLRIVHVQHVAPSERSLLFTPGTSAIALRPEVAPREGEAVVVKHLPSSFVGTALHEALGAQGVDTLVLAGLMAHMCVSSTARDALSLGYRAVVASDACATRDLPDATGSGTLSHRHIHQAALAALADRFAEVATTSAIAALPLVPCVR